jgi:hypothetical protein
MIRPWLIRLPFLLALTAVVAVWVTSYFSGILMTTFLRSRPIDIVLCGGLGQYRADPNYRYPPGYVHVDLYSRISENDWLFAPTTLGFRIGRLPGSPKSLQIILPLWLPTLLLVALNWFLWHKTRPQPPGGAFPVEPAPAKKVISPS